MAGCLLCARRFPHITVFNPLQTPLRDYPYFTDAESVCSFSWDYRFCWQLLIKWAFQWSALTLIYLHYPAISWVSAVHLTLYTLQGIKEMYHLLFFKCSWNDNLYLWIKAAPLPTTTQTTESFAFRARGVLRVKLMRSTSPDLLDPSEIIMHFLLGVTQPHSEKEHRGGEGSWGHTTCAEVKPWVL